MKKWLGFLPGISLLAAIGYGGKLIEHSIAVYAKSHHYVFPNIEYVLWAIVIGLVISNLVGERSWFKDLFGPGIGTYEIFLKVGIVLLGSRFILAEMLKLSGVSFVMIGVELVMAIAVTTYIGKCFGLSQKLTSLLAIGSCICGVSAVIAGKEAIDADDEEVSVAIAVLLTTGAIFLFSFPLIGHFLSLGQHLYGLWAGLAVDNTAEAVAAGALYGAAAGKIAVLAKTARNATIGFVVLGYALYYAKLGMASKVGNKASFLWKKFPKFVLGFLAISILASVGIFTNSDLANFANLSRWAFLFTFAGVGLRTNIRAMARQGWRPFAVGMIAEVAVAGITLGLLVAVNKVVPF
jgi:uncharacterized integral membrane protein (TIGR00698 family)